MSKSDEAIREFAEKWCLKVIEVMKGDDYIMHDLDGCLSDLTALISEGYVAKEEVDKMVSERLRDELIKYDQYYWGQRGNSEAKSMDTLKPERAMTDKSAAAIREFAEKYGGSIVIGYGQPSGSGSIPILTAKEQCFSDLTALISEHCVAKAAYIALENTLAKAEAKNLELLQQRDELKEALTELSGLFEYLHGGAIVGKSIRQRAIAAIKTIER